MRSPGPACRLLSCLLIAACERAPTRGPSAPPQGGPSFSEVAASIGIDFTHESGAAGGYQVPEIMGSGCALFDCDGDSDLDAYLVSAGRDPERARNRLFRNQGGRFQDITVESGAGDAGFGMGCAVGDHDGDGDPDLYLTNFGPNVLLENDGGGAFRDVTTRAGVGDPRWSASALFADIDEDGLLDLFVANYMVHPTSEGEPCADAAGRTEYCGPHAHFPPERNTLYRNAGGGAFRDATAEAGMAGVRAYGLGVASADFNRDGHLDIYVAADETPNQLWLGDGKGRFTDKAVELGAAYNQHGQPQAGMGVGAEDIDGDGLLDLLVTNLVNEGSIFYQGRPGGYFEDVTFATGLLEPSLPVTGFGLGLFDADHDGDLDLMVTNGRVRRGPRVAGAGPPLPWDLYAELDQFFEHVTPGSVAQAPGPARGGGPWGIQFADRSQGAGPAFREPHLGRGLALGDVDGDGDIDLLITACAGRARLLRNDLEKRGHWLIVRARARPGGYDAYGAEVTVEAGGKRWSRTVGPASSYLSSSDPRLHFGLGPATSASITVRWPDGSAHTLTDVAADRVVTVTKDAGGKEP